MKRRKAPTKMTTIVHSGWMTKSPPEGKLNTPFKIFRSQWKRRFFVLSKPQGGLPHQYELEYFKDDRILRDPVKFKDHKKGSIDLEQCEQIISSLDSDQFANLLSIKTIYKHKERTYYLAAESAEDMSNWVEWLCHACHLKQEEQPTDIPEPKPSNVTSNGASTTGVSASTQPVSSALHVSVSAPQTILYPSSTGGTQSPHLSPFDTLVSESKDQTFDSRSSSPQSYIHLDKCTTGPPLMAKERNLSTEDVPEYMAPPPPYKQSHQQSDGDFVDDEHDEVFLKQRPPAPKAGSCGTFDLYKVPPTRNTIENNDEDDKETYDVPPPRRDFSARNYTNCTTESVASINYDYPPPRLDSTTSSEGDLPPERPPKRSPHSHVPSPYQNLPSDLNTVIAPPRPHLNSANSYDVPRSSLAQRNATPRSTGQSASSSLLAVAPAPPKPHRPSTTGAHAYLNAPARPASGSSDTDTSSDRGGDRDQVDSGLAPPAIPPPRQGSGADSLDGRSVSPHSALYQTPPPSSGSSTSSGAPPGRPPARMHSHVPSKGSTSSESGPTHIQDEGCNIFSTRKTRSFKKEHNINNNISHGLKSRTLPMTERVPLPQPYLPTRPGEATSDEEEEATHHPISLLHSVPAPSDPEGELKYIDLALPHTGPDLPRASHGHSHNHQHTHSHTDKAKESATEYREIDFVKTAALNEAKRVKDKERKHDDHH